MLRSATVALAVASQAATAVARNRARLDEVAAEVAGLGGRLVPAAVDYRDGRLLARALSTRVEQDGPFELAVCWIHSVAPDAPGIVAAHVTDSDGGRFFHVLSHAAADPAVSRRWRSSVLAANSRIRYRQVVLGEIRRAGRRRWLTRQEISEGTIRAIELDSDLVVGSLPDA